MTKNASAGSCPRRTVTADISPRSEDFCFLHRLTGSRHCMQLTLNVPVLVEVCELKSPRNPVITMKRHCNVFICNKWNYWLI